MLSSKFSLYLGKENSQGYTDFIAEDAFYCIVEIEDGYTKEQGKALTSILKEKSRRPVENLYAFELFMMDAVKQANVPAHFSLAAFLRKGDMIYMKTAGAGQIFLNREGEFARIIEGDNSASGYMRKEDLFILTTSRFTQLVGNEKHFKQIFSAHNLEKNIEELGAQLENKDDRGVIALFLVFSDSSASVVEVARPEIPVKTDVTAASMAAPSFMSRLQDKLSFLKQGAEQSPLRRAVTFVAVGIVMVILLWSVVLGYQRRSESELFKKIQSSKEIINHKLIQAEAVSAINVPNAVALIAQAKDELSNLKKAVGNKNASDIKELEQSIKAKEQVILKKEEKTANEFFDLTVDNKSASADALSLSTDNAVILDKKRAVIYTLSLTQKSLDTRSSSTVKQATLVGKNGDTIIFFVPSSGVYTIDKDSKVKKVIDNDSDWGSIVDLAIFGGNIYLLDSAKNDVYKYVATDSGYGAKTSYLRGQTVNLKDSNSLAIDASVYVGFSDGALKFTSGIADTFKTSFPDENVSVTRIFTSEDVTNVYAWDKTKGSIYVLTKNGTYEKLIKSANLSQAKGIVVYADTAYVIVGSKVYSISVK